MRFFDFALVGAALVGVVPWVVEVAAGAAPRVGEAVGAAAVAALTEAPIPRLSASASRQDRNRNLVFIFSTEFNRMRSSMGTVGLLLAGMRPANLTRFARHSPPQSVSGGQPMTRSWSIIGLWIRLTDH